MNSISYNELPEEVKLLIGDFDECKSNSYTEEDVSYYLSSIEFRRWMNEKEQKQKTYIKEKKTKMAENKRMYGREKCGFCFSAGTSSRLYLSHVNVKNCPTLAKAMCSKCGDKGHTRKHCRSEVDKHIRLPYKYNRRPQNDEDDDFTYNEGDSENWSDSDSEKERVEEKKEDIVPVTVVPITVVPLSLKKTWASIVKKSV